MPQQAAIQDPVIRYVPPPRYVTDPPLPRPDFEAPGTNTSSQRQPSPRQAELSDNPPLQQAELSDNLPRRRLLSDYTNTNMSSSKDDQPSPPVKVQRP